MSLSIGTTSTTISFSDAEVPVISPGPNAALTLTFAPNPIASLILSYNGRVLTQGADYTVLNNVVTFLGSLADMVTAQDNFQAWYRH